MYSGISTGKIFGQEGYVECTCCPCKSVRQGPKEEIVVVLKKFSWNGLFQSSELCMFEGVTTAVELKGRELLDSGTQF